MHYYSDNQNREHRLTRDIVKYHRQSISDVLGLNPSDIIFCEFEKRKYGANGDVDIAVLKNPDQKDETIIAVEVKVIHLNRKGEFKSEKQFKHNKQLKALVREWWDYVFFFDFIVVEPSESWFHEQAFDGFNKYTKSVESSVYGHAIFQINPVAHKPEAEAGSISPKLIKAASPNTNNPGRKTILSALREHYTTHTSTSPSIAPGLEWRDLIRFSR